LDKKYRVSELIEQGVLVIGDGYRAKNSELAQKGIPFARAGNVNNGEFLFDRADYFPLENLHKVGEKVSQVGDVVFTSKGTVGRFAYVTERVPKFVYSPQLCFWRSKNQDVLQSRFLYYWMQGKEFLQQMNAVKGQTDMADYVSLSDQRKMYITVPSVKKQEPISFILGSLDDKIELNRRMNETLEQMAMALYKHWFVDFGPFQDGEFEETESGPIPKGWKMTKLSALVNTQYGYTASASAERVGPRFLRGTDINKTTHIDWTAVPYCKIAPEDYEKYRLLPGDVVVIRMADPGKPAIMEQEVDAVFASYLVRLKIKEGSGLTPYYLFYFLLSDRYQNYISGASNGTTRKNANAKVLTDIDIIVPDADVVRLFEEKVGLLRQMITRNIQETNALKDLRDYLFPRLLSGEIEVREAEEQVEEVLANA
jgi:type I restriction enzyme S subunit